jgi:ribosome-binding ATPase YchF (GTP1/OBG family)
MLDLITFFTVGADEVRAWTIRPGTRAPYLRRILVALVCKRIRPKLHVNDGWTPRFRV